MTEPKSGDLRLGDGSIGASRDINVAGNLIQISNGLSQAKIAEVTRVVLAEQAKRASENRPTATENTILELARLVAPRTSTVHAALNELRNAVEIAGRLRGRAKASGGLPPLAKDVIAELDRLNANREIEAGVEVADRAVQEAEDRLRATEYEEAELEKIQKQLDARKAELLAKKVNQQLDYNAVLDTAIDQHFLAFDAAGAARQIIRRVMSISDDPSARLSLIAEKYQRHFDRGRSLGIAIELEVAYLLMDNIQNDDPTFNAITQNSKGDAISALGQLLRQPYFIENAISHFDQAVHFSNKAQALDIRRISMIKKADALSFQGELSGSREILQDAVKVSEAALSEISSKSSPYDFGIAKRVQGNAFSSLHELSLDRSDLEKSIVAHRQAIKALERTGETIDLASSRLNLGVALLIAKASGDQKSRLVEAIALFRAALAIFSADTFPSFWATAQLNLGFALTQLSRTEAKASNRAARLYSALAVCREATRMLAGHADKGLYARALLNLSNVLSELSELGHYAQRQQEAFAVILEAARFSDCDRAPFDWVRISIALGSRLLDAAGFEQTPDMLFQAAAAFTGAFELATEKGFTMEAGSALASLSLCRMEMFDRSQETSHLDEAERFLVQAIELFQQLGAEAELQKVGAQLELIGARRGR